ncbi:MAG: EAL domain-containing protein [Ruminococcus sp.]|nr:EAL domain-containing protein [Ruminococcus sp.]
MSNDITDRELKFYQLYEELVSAMTDFDDLDPARVRVKISELCAHLRIAKAVTRLYRNEREEREGKGETIATFLSNKPCTEYMKKRIVTSVLSICTLTIYKADDEPELDDFEKSSCDLVMRTVMSFVSRNRMRDLVKELAFFDDNGYKNLRSLINFLMHYSNAGTLGGRAAINYNLRHFALVNQQLGRPLGDVVMRTHYETLEKMIGSRGIVVRLGGDNFVCVCGAEQLDDVVSYLTETVVVYDKTDGSGVKVTTSAGVYPFPEEYRINNHNEVMGKIVNAFRAAQSGGKEHIVFFSDRLLKGREKSMRVQQLFPDALRNEDFKVFYQPKVDVTTGRLRGAEALCRWFHNGKIVPPIDFIPSLEQTNDICKLDMYMLSHVCRDIKRWLEEGRDVVKDIRKPFKKKYDKPTPS